jgi:hypothetical protein
MKGGMDNWLTYEPPTSEIMPFDYNRLVHEIRPGDVLLIEGRSRISHIINTITLSSWTHAGLYIGRLVDIEDEDRKKLIKQYLPADAEDNSRLVFESLIDQGSVQTRLATYRNHHIRICRPIGISPMDVNAVIDYALRSLGQPYNVRQLLDLARFLLPWTLMPRRWGSSLFRTATGDPESGICSSLIAEAFSSVQFPILPYIKQDEKEGIEVYQRNPYLFTPKDFDVSPYFEIIKYPLFNPEEPLPYYKRMPWTKSGFLHQDKGILGASGKKKADTPEGDDHSHDENT